MMAFHIIFHPGKDIRYLLGQKHLFLCHALYYAESPVSGVIFMGGEGGYGNAVHGSHGAGARGGRLVQRGDLGLLH